MAARAKIALYNIGFTMEAKVLVKSSPFYCLNPRTTQRALYRRISPVVLCFTLKTHFLDRADRLQGTVQTSQVLFSTSNLYSSVIAACQCFHYGLFIACQRVLGLNGSGESMQPRKDSRDVLVRGEIYVGTRKRLQASGLGVEIAAILIWSGSGEDNLGCRLGWLGRSARQISASWNIQSDLGVSIQYGFSARRQLKLLLLGIDTLGSVLSELLSRDIYSGIQLQRLSKLLYILLVQLMPSWIS